MKLTQRQQQALDFVRAFVAKNGHPPTLREIGEHMGISSTNGVSDHLNALERKGVVVRGSKGKARNIRLVARGRGCEALEQLRAMSGWVRESPGDRVADALDHLIVLMGERYQKAAS